MILLDSGSSSSFISQELVAQLQIHSVTCAPLAVWVANGAIMQCSSLVPSVVWTIDQYHFTHDLKVLPLDSYDIILGMDWLPLFSPMKVDWRQRWLAIPYHGITIHLQGISSSAQPGIAEDLVVQLCGIPPVSSDQCSDTPPAIQQLLSEFQTVTTPPSELPPERSCDHAIPLVEGAQPVNIHAYRYPPGAKR